MARRELYLTVQIDKAYNYVIGICSRKLQCHDYVEMKVEYKLSKVREIAFPEDIML